MSQQIENTTQSGLGKSIGDIVAALKSSIGAGSAENGMFANLLAETGKSMPKVEAKDVVAEPVRKDTPSADKPQAAKDAPKEKEDARLDDKREEKKETADVKGDEQKTVETAKENQAETPVDGLKKIEEQMTLLMQEIKAVDVTAEGDAAPEVSEEELALLSLESEDALSLDDVKEFLSSLLPEEKSEAKAAILDQILADNEDISAEELLEQAGLALEALIQQQKQQVETSNVQGTQKEAALLEGDAADLTEAVAKIADKMALLKEGRDSAPEKGLEAKLNAVASEKATGAEEGLYQKMVQEQRQESLGRKNGVAHNIEAPKFVDGVNAETAKAQPANALGQAVAAAAQAAKGASETAKPAMAPAASSSPTITPTGAEGVRSSGSYDFASQLSAARETKGGTAGLPKVIEQVSVQLHKAVKNGNTEMTLNLKPAELGKVEVKLTFGEGKSVTGVVLAENQASLNLLQKDADVLVRALQEAGLDADAGSMEFSLKEEGSAFAQAQNGQEHKAKGQKLAVATDVDAAGDELPEIGAEAYYIEPGRVNLQV